MVTCKELWEKKDETFSITSETKWEITSQNYNEWNLGYMYSRDLS